MTPDEAVASPLIRDGYSSHGNGVVFLLATESQSETCFQFGWFVPLDKSVRRQVKVFRRFPVNRQD
jgi:hypothetical protein